MDYNNEIMIPQNEKKNFIIKKSDIWNYAIDIILDVSQEIEYINLYLILKSFVESPKYICYGIAITIKTHDKIIVAQKESIIFIKKIDLLEFKEWIDFRISNDSKYDNFNNFISLTMLFEKTLIKNEKEDILSYLKPKYPWSEYQINHLKKYISTNEYYKLQIAILKKKIKELENPGI